jgi:hypothetical protein
MKEQTLDFRAPLLRSTASWLLRKYLKTAQLCASTGCTVCARDVDRYRRELAARRVKR